MNPLEQMLVFTRVAELTSFTQAADSLGLPKASVSEAVRQLEARLGTRLLHRTTRKVQPTQDGQLFYERSKDLLADVDDLHTMFQQGTAGGPAGQGLRGRVRLDMPTGTSREIVFPRLPELLALHPLLEVELSSTERRVDLVREGFDCVVRAGDVVDTALIARPLGRMRMVNCASPAYIEAHGNPQSLEDLAQHRLIHFVTNFGAKPGGFEYMDGDRDRRIAMQGSITVNNADAYAAACLAGFGIIQVPLMGAKRLIDSGSLVEVLQRYPSRPMPLTLLYANRRNLSRRVRVVMDWIAQVVDDYMASER